MKRELTTEEKNIYDKQLSKFYEGQKIISGEVKKLEFDRDFLLEHEYNKKKFETNLVLKRTNADLKEMTDKINIMEEHIKNGVEVKEKSAENITDNNNTETESVSIQEPNL